MDVQFSLFAPRDIGMCTERAQRSALCIAGEDMTTGEDPAIFAHFCAQSKLLLVFHLGVIEHALVIG